MTKRVSIARLAALPLALAAAFPVLAQTTSSLAANVALKDVVVTSNRVPTPLNDVLADVTVIDRATLDLAGQSSLRDLLGQQPGVQYSTTGGYRSTTSIFLRGASNSQALILVDGVRVGSATAGGAALENIPVERIERIEILRGAASALYGPDAVGGVIQIFTREPTGTPQFTANAGVGSDGQRQAGASVRGSSGTIGYSLGLSTERASGISVLTTPANFSYNPDNDSFSAHSLNAKLTAKLSNEHSLTLSLLDSHTDYQFDGTPFPNPLNLTALTTDAWSRINLRNVNLKWDAQWTPQWKSTLLLGSSHDESVSDYYRYSDGALGGNSYFNTRRNQATWQNDFAFGRDVLSFMLETRSEAVDSSTLYTVSSRDIHSALLSYALNRADWNALVVVRNDDNSQFGSFNNWSLSGGYRLSANLRAIASVGTSFQAPTFNQLYYPGFGTPTLTPQRNRSSELGLKYALDALSFSAVVYDNEVKGFIVPSTNVQSALAKLQGVTLTAAYQQGDTNYSASYDYADPRTEPSDQRLVRIAHNVLRLNASQRFGDITAFGEYRLSSDREDNKVDFSAGRDTLAGYGLLNVGLSWRLQPNLSLLARINNLNDVRYVLANGYSMPGRNAFVSLSWSN
jgi:vitamin B12 transporter